MVIGILPVFVVRRSLDQMLTLKIPLHSILHAE